MAVSISNQYSAGAPAVSSTSSPSLTFTANQLGLIIVFNDHASATPNTPTISGASRTFTQIATALDASSRRRVTIFRTLAGSTDSGAITIDFGGQTQANVKYSYDAVTGMDTTGTNGSGAIVQNGSNTNSGTTTGITVTLSAFALSANAAYGGVFTNTGSAITTGSGFTQLVNDTGLFANHVQWKINDNTVDWSWASQSAIALAMAIEIKDAAGSPSPSASVSSSVSPSPSSSISPTPSSSVSASISPSPSLSISPTPSASVSLSISLSPSASVSLTPSTSVSLSPSLSPSVSASLSISPSPSSSTSPSGSVSLSPSTSVSLSPSLSSSATPSESMSISLSVSLSPSLSPSGSASLSVSRSPSLSVSLSPSGSASASESRSSSPSHSPSSSRSRSVSPSISDEIPGNVYTREAKVALPTTKDDLATVYTVQEEIDVFSLDDVYVGLTGAASRYLIHQFKKKNDNRHDSIKVRIDCKSTLAPSSKAVYLQIWNGTTQAWTSMDTETERGANEDMTLMGSITTDQSIYYDFGNEVAVRVYQENDAVGAQTLSMDWVKISFVEAFSDKYAVSSRSFSPKYPHENPQDDQ